MYEGATVAPTNTVPTQPGRIIMLNGLKMYYEEHGSGEPLILLHGGTVTSSMWQTHIPFFAQHFRVIAPDSRGHGRTNNPTGEFSYRLMAGDVAAFVQALGLTKPLICGYSDGGQIALEIGMRYPNLTRALVVSAAWYKFSEVYLNFLKEFGFDGPGMVNIEQIRRATPDFVEFWQTEHSRADDPDYWQTLLRQISTMWWTPLNYSDEDFQKITEPALILMGDRDGTIELEQAVEMYQLIPNAELAILPNATHMSAAEGKLFTDIVLDFLLRHTVAANTANKEAEDAA
jgi:pimeloyl-ACP methyl ester carboxylesterase